MAIIDAGKHQVFVVPAEGRVLHSNVEPWSRDARDFVLPAELHKRVICVWKVVKIPRMARVLYLRVVNDFLAKSMKTRANFCSIKVRRIFNFKLVALL